MRYFFEFACKRLLYDEYQATMNVSQPELFARLPDGTTVPVQSHAQMQQVDDHYELVFDADSLERSRFERLLHLSASTYNLLQPTYGDHIIVIVDLHSVNLNVDKTHLLTVYGTFSLEKTVLADIARKVIKLRPNSDAVKQIIDAWNFIKLESVDIEEIVITRPVIGEIKRTLFSVCRCVGNFGNRPCDIDLITAELQRQKWTCVDIGWGRITRWTRPVIR